MSANGLQGRSGITGWNLKLQIQTVGCLGMLSFTDSSLPGYMILTKSCLCMKQ